MDTSAATDAIRTARIMLHAARIGTLLLFTFPSLHLTGQIAVGRILSYIMANQPKMRWLSALKVTTVDAFDGLQYPSSYSSA
ncbi:hypothetical protein F5Y05DRAFT_411131 [Hypoxylon sp. FL0543]|nr:hypothetical protein F5Y05DRAFT_411131 [Hypoxylon sp. FL0543]